MNNAKMNITRQNQAAAESIDLIDGGEMRDDMIDDPTQQKKYTRAKTYSVEQHQLAIQASYEEGFQNGYLMGQDHARQVSLQSKMKGYK